MKLIDWASNYSPPPSPAKKKKREKMKGNQEKMREAEHK